MSKNGSKHVRIIVFIVLNKLRVKTPLFAILHFYIWEKNDKMQRINSNNFNLLSFLQ